MEFGNYLPCYSGIDRFSVLTKTEKWLAEYRHFKIRYLRDGLFNNKDYSVLLSKITDKEKKRLKEIGQRIPLLKFTPTRIQFLNEKKVLTKLLKESKLAYRKRRDCYSVCQRYDLNITDPGLDLSARSIKDVIWWSIGYFTYSGTGQEKIASRISRNRVLVNRKLKTNPYLDVINRHIELKKYDKSFKKGDLAARNNSAILKKLKGNPEHSKGLIFKKVKKSNGTEYVALIKVLPNYYETNIKIKNQITIDSKKTFRFTKKESNRLHFKNLNERSKRVHANVAFKAFNEKEDLAKGKGRRSWNISKRKFLKGIMLGSGSNIQEHEYMIRPNNSLLRNLKLFTSNGVQERWLIHEIAS